MPTNPLSDICFTDIFSYSVLFLFFLLTVPSTEHTFLILMKFYLSHFSLMDHALVSCLRTLYLTLGYEDVLLCFLLKVLQIYIQIYDPFSVDFYAVFEVYVKVHFLHTITNSSNTIF